jgi:hypothetical protein
MAPPFWLKGDSSKASILMLSEVVMCCFIMLSHSVCSGVCSVCRWFLGCLAML